MFWALCFLSTAAKLRERAFNSLVGSWHGHMAASPSEDLEATKYANLSINFEKVDGGNHLVISIVNETENTESVYYLKKDSNDEFGLTIETQIGDLVSDLKVKSVRTDDFYIFRGLVKPKNDQITVSLEENYLSVVISDQFSANVTIMTFNQEFRNKMINNVLRTGLMFTVVVVIFVALYKASDLADVITPEEARVTDEIVARSKAADRRKNNAEKKEKND